MGHPRDVLARTAVHIWYRTPDVYRVFVRVLGSPEELSAYWLGARDANEGVYGTWTAEDLHEEQLRFELGDPTGAASVHKTLQEAITKALHVSARDHTADLLVRRSDA